MNRKFCASIAVPLVALSVAVLTSCQTQPLAQQDETTSQQLTNTTDAAAKPQELTDVKFTLSWALQGVDAPLLVAIDKGYFQQEGLNVEFARGSGSADAVTKIASGQYDIGFGDINSMMQFNSENPDQQVVAVYMLYNELPMGVVLLRESGVTTPQDLVGKEIAAPAGSASRKFFPLFAESAGIDPDAVKWASVDTKLMPPLLLQKEVDGLSGFITSQVADLITQENLELEDLTIFPYGEYGLELYGNAVMVRKEFAEQNPERIQAFLRAFNKGLKDTLNDPDGSVERMAKYDPVFDVSVEQVRLKLAMELWSTPETDQIGLGAVDMKRMETAIQKVAQGFELTQTQPATEVFDDRFLPAREERSL
jgi:NitT/TauT family transport system substrate-binding protein